MKKGSAIASILVTFTATIFLGGVLGYCITGWVGAIMGTAFVSFDLMGMYFLLKYQKMRQARSGRRE